MIRVTRWWRLAGTIAAVLLLAGPALPWTVGGRVAAHAQLVASFPGAGAIVPSSPGEVRLVFSEPLETQFTSLDLTGEDGTLILSQAGEIDPHDPYALVVIAPDLADGIYQVTWRTLSAADGHTGEGTFSFGVGSGTAPPSAADSRMTHTQTDPARAAGRWLTYIGLLLAIGVPVFHRVVVRSGPMPRALVRLLAAGLAISALAALGTATVAALEAGSVLDYLLGSRNGALQLARAAVAGLGAAALLLVARRFSGAAAAATGLAGIGLLVGAGHAAALPSPVPILGQLVHVVGAAVWIGGIVGLVALLIRPRILTGSDARPAMRTFVPRFSALALVSIGLVAMTGVYAAWVQTGALVTLETEYGRTLVLKSGFALGALALGGLNFLDGGRMRGWLDGMRPRLTLELMLVGVVLVLTAALAITPPVEEASGVAIEPIPDAFGEVLPGMSMQVVPGRPGVNRVVVGATDALATGSSSLELVIDRLDTGGTTRVPLVIPGMDAAEHMAGMGHTATDELPDWTADAIVLPADGDWDTSVRIVSPAGTELARQRFAFTMDAETIDEGRAGSLLDPAAGIALVLFIGGAVGLGLGIGGMALPRCEPLASRLALIGGGAVAVTLGAAIGASRLIG